MDRRTHSHRIQVYCASKASCGYKLAANVLTWDEAIGTMSLAEELWGGAN